MSLAAVVFIVAVCVTIAGSVLAACLHLDRRDGRGAPPILSQYMVNVTGQEDVVFRGLLVSRGHGWVVLDNAEVLQGDGSWSHITGRQYIPAGRVLNLSKL